MYQALKKARQIAGWDLFPYYAHRCIIDQTYRQTISRGVQAAGLDRAAEDLRQRLFRGPERRVRLRHQDQRRPDRVDALNSAEEAKTYIIGGMQKLGLNPKDVKYIVISHSHGDHYAGAEYLREVTGAPIVASEIDWGVMTKPPAPPAAARPQRPGRDRHRPGRRRPDGGPRNGCPPTSAIKTDGEKWTVGDTTFTFYITPPHAPGVLSPFFNVFDKGEKHVAAVYGGLGTPAGEAEKNIHIQELERFRALAKAAGADVLLSTHQTQDQAIWKLEELRLRRAGDPNPYVIGVDRYQRYVQLQQACTAYAAAQQGQKIKVKF